MVLENLILGSIESTRDRRNLRMIDLASLNKFMPEQRLGELKKIKIIKIFDGQEIWESHNR